MAVTHGVEFVYEGVAKEQGEAEGCMGWDDMGFDDDSGEAYLGFNTGTGLPTVFPKRVSRVRVRFWFLADRDRPRTRSAVSRVCTGTLQ